MLTGYPTDFKDQYNTSHLVPSLCAGKWTDDGIMIFGSYLQTLVVGRSLTRAIGAAAGFLFMRGEAVVEVPYPPDLHHLFHGEEVLHSIRLFTAGYDFFNPDQNVIWHSYTRAHAPKFWSAGISGWAEGMAHAKQRVKDLLEGKPVPGLQLGGVRSLDEYWKFAGTDPVSKANATRLC